MTRLLALDAGGTTTRALLVAGDGTILGRGRSGPGNPTSAGAVLALASVAQAAGQALVGHDPAAVELAVLAMAGERHLLTPEDLRTALGVPGGARVDVVSDVLAMFRSGGAGPTGAAIVAGTGSNAARVEDGVVVRTAGGAGWLLGDAASGFAIGHAVVRAVVADEHGLGPVTALTPRILAEVGGSLSGLVTRSYADRPVALARFAPLAFELAFEGAGNPVADPVAAGIVAAAQDDLAVLVRQVAQPGDPLVVGGSVAHHGLLAVGRPRTPRLVEALAGLDLRSARDGAVGAAVVALTTATGDPRLGPAVLQRLTEGVSGRSG